MTTYTPSKQRKDNKKGTMQRGGRKVDWF